MEQLDEQTLETINGGADAVDPLKVLDSLVTGAGNVVAKTADQAVANVTDYLKPVIRWFF